MIQYTALQAMHLKHQEVGFRINNAIAHSYIFLHFINPVCITLNDKTINTSSNACIIFTPGSKLQYSAKHIEIFHNFLHFNVVSEEYFKALELPLNAIFYTNLQDEITNAVEMVEICTVKKFPNHMEFINTQIKTIFNLLHNEQSHNILYGGISTEYRFKTLRSTIFIKPKDWSVPKMAAHVNLSRSRFSTKYKKLFGVSPNNDLIYATLLYANKMLSTTDIKICDLTRECGFSSTDYFIRLFKKYYGMTPGAYRTMCLNKNKRN